MFDESGQSLLHLKIYYIYMACILREQCKYTIYKYIVIFAVYASARAGVHTKRAIYTNVYCVRACILSAQYIQTYAYKYITYTPCRHAC